MIEAKVIADSIYGGSRITTMQVTMHRFVLAEFNTHRAFSRNSASSRAIPIIKRIWSVWSDTAYPMEWGKNQKGMQAGEQLSEGRAFLAKMVWGLAAKMACLFAWILHCMGLHKQLANRLLEPFLWHTVVVTSTEWENFFEQRCSPLAQPEIRIAAWAMKNALEGSTPVEREFHTPYGFGLTTEDLLITAVGCCAGSSYGRFGEFSRADAFRVFRKMYEAKPRHWSPFEHVAKGGQRSGPGNFKGWAQLRHSPYELARLYDIARREA